MIKLKDILNEASTSESFSQMKNLMGNAIPMMFPKEEGAPYDKWYYKTMQNGDVGVFIQRLSVGDPSAIKLWPKVSKVIYKNINTVLNADRLEIDLITKNSRIFMEDKYEKIKVLVEK